MVKKTKNRMKTAKHHEPALTAGTSSGPPLSTAQLGSTSPGDPLDTQLEQRSPGCGYHEKAARTKMKAYMSHSNISAHGP